MTRVIQCDACGGSLVYDAGREAATCLFCGSVALRPEDLVHVPTPDAAIPFAIEPGTADEQFRRWARSSWWYPKELRGLKVELSAAMLPAWRFYATLETHWTGLASARTRSGYRPRGGVESAELQTLIPASLGLSERELSALSPFDEEDAAKWEPEEAGVPYEPPSLSEPAAREQARERLTDIHRRRIGASEELTATRASAVVSFDASRLVMLPIWIGSFRYRDLPWRFVINAQTGRVTGKAPLDRVKVAMAVTLVMVVAAVIAWLRLRS